MQIVVLTGAGISAESGIDTFRDKGGVWTKVRLEDVATPEGYARDPEKVLAFYNQRRTDMLDVKANAAHIALARLEKDLPQKIDGASVTIVTQNVDDLHEKAGSETVIHMHGELAKAWCAACDWRGEWLVDMETQTPCPQCAQKGQVRPDVVWFGEVPYHMDTIYQKLGMCDLFVSIGTSGEVYPAADFVQEANMCGARTLELNLQPSYGASSFDESDYGPATQVVPRWVGRLLSEIET